MSGVHDPEGPADPVAAPIGVTITSLAAFTTIALLIVADIAQDAFEGAPWGHLAVESLAMGLAAIGALRMAVSLARSRSELHRARIAHAAADARAAALASEAAAFRARAADAVGGFRQAIDHQFADWGLTEAERDVAIALLQGLQTRDIARARGTTDRTVRQQAQTIYAKAGLAGRAELAAFFLTGLR